ESQRVPHLEARRAAAFARLRARGVDRDGRDVDPERVGAVLRREQRVLARPAACVDHAAREPQPEHGGLRPADVPRRRTGAVAVVPGGYLPAFDETNCATAVICASLSLPLKAGIGPPPTSTWCWTIACDGFSWSRFGPIVPVAPAAFSVWQLEHCDWKI